MTTTSLILNSLLKERWSISFKLYKRKKTSYCKCTIYRITSKTNQGDTENTKIRLTSNWTGNPLESILRLFCCTVVHNSKSASVCFPRETVKPRINLCRCQGTSQPAPWPEPQAGRAGVVDSPIIPAPSLPVKPTFLEESETPAPTGAQELLN